MKKPIFESEKSKLLETAEDLKKIEKYLQQLKENVIKMDKFDGQSDVEEKLLDLQISSFRLSIQVQNLLKIKK